MSSTEAQILQAMPGAIVTPCIKACIVDGASGLCLGCFRTLSEIACWSGMTDSARVAIIAALPERAVQNRP